MAFESLTPPTTGLYAQAAQATTFQFAKDMGSKPSVLFAIFERLSDPVVQSQALEHVRIMQRLGVATFEIWAAAWDAEMLEQTQRLAAEAAERAEAPVHVWQGVPPRWPFSTRINGFKFLASIRRRSGPAFTHLHARNDYAAAASVIPARHLGVPLIWDCRGDAKAEIASRVGLSASNRWLREQMVERRMRRAAYFSQRAVFVSDPLRGRMASHWKDRPSFIIPCAAAADLFFFDENLRQKIRTELGFSEETTVFIYSGSLVAYQKFNETVEMYKRIAATRDNTRLLVLTRERKKAREIIGDRSDTTISSASHGDINGYLNAADFAFMLRDAVPINTVASPTKFAEYGLAGLPVIMSKSVPDSHDLARTIGNLIDVTDSQTPEQLARIDRTRVAHEFRQRLTKEAQAQIYAQLYS